MNSCSTPRRFNPIIKTERGGAPFIFSFSDSKLIFSLWIVVKMDGTSISGSDAKKVYIAEAFKEHWNVEVIASFINSKYLSQTPIPENHKKKKEVASSSIRYIYIIRIVGKFNTILCHTLKSCSHLFFLLEFLYFFLLLFSYIHIFLFSNSNGSC